MKSPTALILAATLSFSAPTLAPRSGNSANGYTLPVFNESTVSPLLLSYISDMDMESVEREKMIEEMKSAQAEHVNPNKYSSPFGPSYWTAFAVHLAASMLDGYTTRDAAKAFERVGREGREANPLYGSLAESDDLYIALGVTSGLTALGEWALRKNLKEGNDFARHKRLNRRTRRIHKYHIPFYGSALIHLSAAVHNMQVKDDVENH